MGRLFLGNNGVRRLEAEAWGVRENPWTFQLTLRYQMGGLGAGGRNGGKRGSTKSYFGK